MLDTIHDGCFGLLHLTGCSIEEEGEEMGDNSIAFSSSGGGGGGGGGGVLRDPHQLFVTEDMVL